MSKWTVQHEDKHHKWSEKQVRKKLRSGDLTGLELARPPDQEEWAPLHDTALFREEVAHVGDPGNAARMRALTGFGWHFASFAAVMWFFGFPFWGAFWGIGLAAHAVKMAPILMEMRQQKQPAPLRVSRPEPEPVSDDPFEQRLAKLLAAIPNSADATAVATSIRETRTRRMVLDEALEGGLLPEELEAAQDRVESAVSEHDRASFAEEVAALEAHMKAQDKASRARDRLAARERELFHVLESVRLAQLNATSSDDDDVPRLLHEARRKYDAEAELDEELALARRRNKHNIRN
jgi:hypothetical protein